MAARSNDVDDDEELGAYIYQTSHTAKIFREKAAEASSLSASLLQQTQRKSPRLLAKEQDIPTPVVVPEKSTITSNISTKQRTKRNRKLVLKEESCIPVCPKSSCKTK